MTQIDWTYPPIFGIDLKSIYKSLWLGWWLVTWSDWTDVSIVFQPGL